MSQYVSVGFFCGGKCSFIYTSIDISFYAERGAALFINTHNYEYGNSRK